MVIVYSFGLIKPIEFLDILGIRRTAFSWAIAAFAGVVFLGTLKGIVVAIIVSLVTLAHQVADPPVYILRRKPGVGEILQCTQKPPAPREDERKHFSTTMQTF